MERLSKNEKKELYDNFDIDTLGQMDVYNIREILKYLNSNGIDYSKDIFLEYFDLFLLDYNDFIKRFEVLKDKLGDNYKDKLESDLSLLSMMYS